MERRLAPLVAAAVLVLGWGGLLVFAFAGADAVRWTPWISAHMQCQTLTRPFLGEPYCVAEVGALGVAAAVTGALSGLVAFVALLSRERGGLTGAALGAWASGAVLALGVLVGIARSFAGLAEVPFDAAVLAFALAPALALARAAGFAPLRFARTARVRAAG